MNHSLPNVPFGCKVGDVEIINSTPSDIGYVTSNYRFVIGRVEHVVHQF